MKVMKDIFNPEKRRSRYCMGLIMYILGIIISPIMCLLVPGLVAFDAGVFIAYMTIIYIIYSLLDVAIEYALFPEGKVQN